MNLEGCTSSFPAPVKVGTCSCDMARHGCGAVVAGIPCGCRGSGAVCVDGEPND